MDLEAKREVTKAHVAKMLEDRETRLTGENNTGISAFHDCRATLEVIEKQVSISLDFGSLYELMISLLDHSFVCSHRYRGSDGCGSLKPRAVATASRRSHISTRGELLLYNI